MTVKYTLDRKSLYDGNYSNSQVNILSGNNADKIKLKTHFSVIYRLIKHNRRKVTKDVEEKADKKDR